MAGLPYKRILAVALLALGGGSLVPACTDQETSLFIRGVMAAQPPACVFNADGSAPLLGSGIVDRAFGPVSYQAALLVGNQMVARSDSDRLRVETSRIALKEAIVRVTRGDAVLKEYRTPGTGFVDPGTGRQAGLGVFFATLLPGDLGADGDVFVVNVRVTGETLGGLEVESAELSYPIQVCYGCLIAYPAAAADPTQQVYTCVASPDANVQSPCRIGVDEEIDCRLCSGDLPICRTPTAI